MLSALVDGTMNRRYCKLGQQVRVGFILRRGNLGNGKTAPHLDSDEAVGFEGVVALILDDEACVINGERRLWVAIERLNGVLS
jgi:hypothetical protein